MSGKMRFQGTALRSLLPSVVGMALAVSLAGQEAGESRQLECVELPVTIWPGPLGSYGVVLGIGVVPADSPRYDSRGVRIQTILREGEGMASRLGLRAGDLITTLNDRRLTDPLDDEELTGEEPPPLQRLRAILGELRPGDTVTVEFLRGEERRSVQAVTRREDALSRSVAWAWARGSPSTLGLSWFGDRVRGRAGTSIIQLLEGDSLVRVLRRARPGRTARARAVFPEIPAARWNQDSVLTLDAWPGETDWIRWPGADRVAGLRLMKMNAGLAEYFGAEKGRGLLVLEVEEDSELGLREGDVILALQGREIESVAHLRRILRSYADGDVIQFKILRKMREESIETVRD